jgi:hypothetical protein
MPAPKSTSVSGTLQVFGHEDTTAELRVIPRGTAWRAARAGAFVLGGLVLAPVVFILPPHVAWASAAVLTGVFLGYRKWLERHTLVELSGPCPRCGTTIRIESATRLRNPWSVSCEACRHSATLTVSSDELPRPA